MAAGGRKPGPEPGDRLQKVLARAGVASRRKVEDLLREGRVTVGGEPAKLGQSFDPAAGPIRVDGEIIDPGRLAPLYLLVHKPPGVVSTMEDPQGRATVLELVPPELRPGLVPVGRLDFHTSGLLILTTDGDFAQKVAHPRHGCTKTYEAKVKGQPSKEALDKLRRGIRLDGRPTGPCRIEPRGKVRGERRPGDTSWWTVTLGEGRNRQVREMFQRIGHPVRKLRRVAIGDLREPEMPMGTYRELAPGEVARLRAGSGRRRGGKGAGRRPRATAGGPGKARGRRPRR